MANLRMTLLDLLNKEEQGADPSFLRDGVRLLAQELKLRQGAYFPSLLEPRRRHERALLSVVQEAYVHGVSTRAVA
jgi:transposase-like protein